MGMKTENKSKLGKEDSYMSERISTNKTTRILTPCAHVANGACWFSSDSLSVMTGLRAIISVPALLPVHFPEFHSHLQRTVRLWKQEGGRLKGGRADGLYPLPAWFHLCSRWDPIIRPLTAPSLIGHHPLLLIPTVWMTFIMKKPVQGQAGSFMCSCSGLAGICSDFTFLIYQDMHKT